MGERAQIGFRPRLGRRLAAALAATDAVTDAPLRLVAHYAEIGREVFELHEELERGAPGRTLRVALDRRSLEVVAVEQL